MSAVIDVRERLAEPGLEHAATILEDALRRATRDKSDYLTFVQTLLDYERAKRRQRNLEVRTKLAHLPYRKTLEEFDFSFQPSIDERMVRELATMTFVGRQENVMLLGPPGVGKSHLAVALGVEAIRQGLVYLRPKLVIVDEVGYMPLDAVAANLFFHIVSARYERGSLVITSNKSFGEWGELPGDRALATAVLDRLLHHAHILNIRGNSYRLKERRQLADKET